MTEAVSEAAVKWTTFGAPGGPDPHEAGRRGGILSGIARSPEVREERELERKIKASRNGAAQLELLKMRRAQNAQLQARVLKTDKELAEMDLALHDVRQEIARAHVELREAEVKLDERERALGDDDALIALLRSIGEKRCESACVALGWAEVDE